ncbi:hypothetical protein PENTCL1PPCAC_22005, partial [Pristionchus entomophagus]
PWQWTTWRHARRRNLGVLLRDGTLAAGAAAGRRRTVVGGLGGLVARPHRRTLLALADAARRVGG